MRPCFKTIAAAALPVCLLAATAAAQSLDLSLAATPDPLCDYCKDFTDAATASEPARSAYRPGTGYAAAPVAQASTVQPQEAGAIQMVERSSSAKAK